MENIQLRTCIVNFTHKSNNCYTSVIVGGEDLVQVLYYKFKHRNFFSKISTPSPEKPHTTNMSLSIPVYWPCDSGPARASHTQFAFDFVHLHLQTPAQFAFLKFNLK